MYSHGSKPAKSSCKKRVKTSKEAKESEQDANETRARVLTVPLALKVAKVYKMCSKLINQPELMEGSGDTYSENYDIRLTQGHDDEGAWWTGSRRYSTDLGTFLPPFETI